MTNTQAPQQQAPAVGDRIMWVTGHVPATIVRVGHGGEYVIRPDGASICTTTRACFFYPLVSVTR